MIKFLTMLSFLTFTALLVSAAENSPTTILKNDRQPSATPSIRVNQRVSGSQFEKTEVWIDEANQIICYLAARGASTESPSISCVSYR